MSEPAQTAETVQRLVPGLWHWTLHDSRIDFRSEAYAVCTAEGVCAIDPLPLVEAAWQGLGLLESVVLTAACHQRSAWSLRASTGARVYTPRGAVRMEQEPDVEYDDGADLPGGLSAELRVGPSNPHMVLRWAAGDLAVLFCGDLLMRRSGGPFELIPDEHHEDPVRTRAAVRALLTQRCDLLCPAHGAPRLEGGSAAIREALGGGAG